MLALNFVVYTPCTNICMIILVSTYASIISNRMHFSIPIINHRIIYDSLCINNHRKFVRFEEFPIKILKIIHCHLLRISLTIHINYHLYVLTSYPVDI